MRDIIICRQKKEDQNETDKKKEENQKDSYKNQKQNATQTDGKPE